MYVGFIGFLLCLYYTLHCKLQLVDSEGLPSHRKKQLLESVTEFVTDILLFFLLLAGVIFDRKYFKDNFS